MGMKKHTICWEIFIIFLTIFSINVYSSPFTYTLNIDNAARMNILCPNELKKNIEYKVIFELIVLKNITVNVWRIDIYAKKYPYLWLIESYTFVSEKFLERGEYLKKTISIEIPSNIYVYSDVYIEVYFKYNGSRQIDSEIFVAKIVDKTREDLLDEIEIMENEIENLSNRIEELYDELNNVRMSYDYLNINYSKLYGEYIQLYNLYNRLLSNYSLAIGELNVFKTLYGTLEKQYSSLNNSYREMLIKYNLTRNLLTEYRVKYGEIVKLYNNTLKEYVDLTREYDKLKTYFIYTILLNIALIVVLIILLSPKIRLISKKH